jgi:hypothetical protein
MPRIVMSALLVAAYALAGLSREAAGPRRDAPEVSPAENAEQPAAEEAETLVSDDTPTNTAAWGPVPPAYEELFEEIDATLEALGEDTRKVGAVVRRIREDLAVQGTNRPPAALPATGLRVVRRPPPRRGSIPLTGWRSDPWGNKAATQEVEGKLIVTFPVGPKANTSIGKPLPGRPRVLPADRIAVQAENPNPFPVRLAVAFLSGSWYAETPAVTLKPGVNKVAYNMARKDFKTAASGWQYKASLPGPTRVDTLSLVIYSGRPGKVILHGVDLNPPGKKPSK